MRPDKNYEPQVGEWFWFLSDRDDRIDGWMRRQRRSDGSYAPSGVHSYTFMQWSDSPYPRKYGGALPAEPPSAIRYKDPPPPGTKPDPDYLPKEGEWFWFMGASGNSRCLYHHVNNNHLESLTEGSVSDLEEIDRGKCLPAEPPD